MNAMTAAVIIVKMKAVFNTERVPVNPDFK